MRAPLTANDAAVAGAVGRVFGGYFAAGALLDMPLARACEDFALLGAAHGVPYAYWNFGGGAAEGVGEDEGGDAVPTNHSPYFAPEVELTLRTGADAMALAALAFLVG